MSLFTGTEGQFLKPDEAAELISTYHQRKRKVGIKDAEIVRSEFFGIENLRQLLSQPGAVGLRVYHAKSWEDADGNPLTTGDGRLTPRVVLVGVDRDGNDLVSSPAEGLKDMPDEAGFSGFVGRGPICPPECHGGGGGGNQ